MKNRIALGLLMFCIVLTAAFAGISMNTEAKTDKCGKNGCTRDNTSNGTVFCDYHAAEYAREQGYTPCAVSGCYGRPSKGHTYCSKHECSNKDCKSKKETDSSYCKTHQPKTTTSKSTSKSSSSKTYTSSSKKYNSSKKSSGSSSSKKKYDPYDVYNYKSAQDFADDKYEEFYDYEDDYEDEDEAYDAAEDYWRDHHKK